MIFNLSVGEYRPGMAESSSLESAIHEVGLQLAESFPSNARHPIKALDDKAMELASRDSELRAALFRFVDVVPACRSLEDLSRHLSAYLGELNERPQPLGAAMRMADSKAGARALGLAAAAGVRHMAHRFIVGETPSDALSVLHALWNDSVAASVDLLGEATVTVAEADRYAERCDDALRTLHEAFAGWSDRPALERDSFGPIPRVNLSVKVSALTPLLRAEAPEVGKRDAGGRLAQLLRTARELGAHLHVDMESLDSRETVLDLVLELLAEDDFTQGPSAGIVLQAYLRDSPQTLTGILEWAREHRRAHPLVVRLVKGAYWDHEIVEARRHGWPAPVFEDKSDCDRNFEDLTARLIDARSLVRVAIGSHNLRSVAHAIACGRAQGADDRDLEFQVLRGLGDDLQHALAAAGLRVRTYCPVGDLVAGMAYLVRRLLENTSNESFLAAQHRGESVEALLAAP
jgi:RHH-type proline utilization regulon transcriptional repressor/proline dehydrogenase/delta 1-pyrroline-5-carboxylate dehydrogenase